MINTKEFTFNNKNYEITESDIFKYISAYMFDASRNGASRVVEIKGELLVEFLKNSEEFKNPILFRVGY